MKSPKKSKTQESFFKNSLLDCNQLKEEFVQFKKDLNDIKVFSDKAYFFNKPLSHIEINDIVLLIDGLRTIHDIADKRFKFLNETFDLDEDDDE